MVRLQLGHPKNTSLKLCIGKPLMVGLLLTLFGNLLIARDNDLNYLKNGVSFSLPATWRIIADEPIPGKGNYLSAENTGKNATGLFTLVTIATEENPVKTLLVQEKNMKEEKIYQDAGIEFTEIAEAKFGSNPAKKVNYEAIVKGIKVSGIIYCFNCTEKTYLLFLQTGIASQKQNQKAFELLELTFACR